MDIQCGTFRSTLNYVKERNFSPLNASEYSISPDLLQTSVLVSSQSVLHSWPDPRHSFIHSGDHSLQPSLPCPSCLCLSHSLSFFFLPVFGAETLLEWRVCDSSQSLSAWSIWDQRKMKKKEDGIAAVNARPVSSHQLQQRLPRHYDDCYLIFFSHIHTRTQKRTMQLPSDSGKLR